MKAQVSELRRVFCECRDFIRIEFGGGYVECIMALG